MLKRKMKVMLILFFLRWKNKPSYRICYIRGWLKQTSLRSYCWSIKMEGNCKSFFHPNFVHQRSLSKNPKRVDGRRIWFIVRHTKRACWYISFKPILAHVLRSQIKRRSTFKICIKYSTNHCNWASHWYQWCPIAEASIVSEECWKGWFKVHQKWDQMNQPRLWHTPNVASTNI